ncbi:MAG: hypothetical protein JO112_19370 [Planctomycetes bacterium]|nr:hypothetical protein [Planctomycetota bacterium]
MPGPKINDEYWFTYSESLVTKESDRREQAAEKLQNLVLWLWGLYTAAAAVGFALSKKNLSFWPALLIAAASAALIATYWGSVWVRIPLLVEFDPRSPTEIKAAYKTSVQARARRLNITLGLSILAAAMVSLALVLASVTKESQEPKDPAVASFLSSTDGKTTAAVTAHVGKAKTVTMDVQDTTGKSLIVNGPGEYLPTDEGTVQTSIPLIDSPAEVVVIVEWPDATGTTLRLSKKVAREKRSEVSK